MRPLMKTKLNSLQRLYKIVDGNNNPRKGEVMAKRMILVFLSIVFLVACSAEKEKPVDLKQDRLLFLDYGYSDTRAFYLKQKTEPYESTLWNITKELMEASPEEGTAVFARTFYTKASQNHLMKLVSYQTTPGKIDSHAMSYSIDNGNSYYSFAVMNTKSSAMGGTYRRYWQTQIVDPEKDKMIVIFLEGLLPNDNPSEGMSNWTLWYGITTDGGKTFETLEQIIKTGDIYGPEYPVDGVYTGKNSMAVGEITCLPIKLQRQRGSGNGRILVPVQISVLNEHGELYNPGGSFGYLYCAVLIGTWNQEGKLDWDISQPIVADPNKTPIGVMEPTIAEMPSGEILMVMRGGNGGSKDEKYALDCFKWYSYSEDGGYTWTPPKPWMCDDNTVFYSPSSCSQLLEHSNGKYYWIGIVSNTNPQNDYPGWPLVIGEVNPKDFRLIRDSVTVIDIKRPEQSSSVTYTNFFAREDRVSHDILVYCTPMFEQGRSDNPADLTAHTYVYTVNIK
jgi:hypothetical protein